MKRITFQLGKPLEAGQISPSGLYAIQSQKGITLRVTLIPEIAKMLSESSNCTIAECWIIGGL